MLTYTHCFHMETPTDFSAHYQHANTNSFIQSKLFFCHFLPCAPTLLSPAFPYASLLGLCDLILHACLNLVSYLLNIVTTPKSTRISSPLVSDSCTTAFCSHPLGCTSEPKTQPVCCVSSRHVLHLSCRCSAWHVISND